MRSESNLQYASAAHAQLARPTRSSGALQFKQGNHTQINVGDQEREVSMIGGTMLAMLGLIRGSVSGLALVAIGGALIWRGHTGHCEAYHAVGFSTADRTPRRSDRNRT